MDIMPIDIGKFHELEEDIYSDIKHKIDINKFTEKTPPKPLWKNSVICITPRGIAITKIQLMFEGFMRGMYEVL